MGSFLTRFKGPLLFIISELLFCLSHTLVKLNSSSFPSSQLIFFRYGPPVLFMLPYFVGYHFPKYKFNFSFLLLFRCLMGFVSIWSLFLALKEGTFSEVNLIYATGSIWVVALAWFVLKERPSKKTLLAFPLAFVGLFFVLNPHTHSLTKSDYYAILGALTSAMTMLSLKQLSKSVRSVEVIFWFYSLGAILTFIPNFTQFILPTPAGWVSLLLIGLFGYLAQWAMTAGYHYTSASVASGIKLFGPILMIISGILVFHDQIHLTSAIGMLLTFSSLTLIAVYQ